MNCLIHYVKIDQINQVHAHTAKRTSNNYNNSHSTETNRAHVLMNLSGAPIIYLSFTQTHLLCNTCSLPHPLFHSYCLPGTDVKFKYCLQFFADTNLTRKSVKYHKRENREERENKYK